MVFPIVHLDNTASHMQFRQKRRRRAPGPKGNDLGDMGWGDEEQQRLSIFACKLHVTNTEAEVEEEDDCDDEDEEEWGLFIVACNMVKLKESNLGWITGLPPLILPHWNPGLPLSPISTGSEPNSLSSSTSSESLSSLMSPSHSSLLPSILMPLTGSKRFIATNDSQGPVGGSRGKRLAGVDWE
ncbi:hypothetical protein PPACK8108_LOCUS24266 [Phakopsora pachyrhizi]|uniref:Uncharacterized protein n=1 Tax=Phakopsora pachyrhizi TaxID=170000 RepID=A0AAV0BSX4_PHAPC|nr:hypothetical protein PPACK8108_LOCUS24266 [Phakopsora pachyrhizi]